MSVTRTTTIEKQKLTWAEELALQRDTFAVTLPVGYTADKFVELCVLAVESNPGVAKCTLRSVVNAVKYLANLGLDPTGALRSAYLVAFGTNCVPIIGPGGFIQLGEDAGLVRKAEARCVYANEHFKAFGGTDPRIEHEFDVTPGRGELIAVYATLWLTNGEVKFIIKTKAELDKVMHASPSGMKGAWVWFDQMGMAKTLKYVYRETPIRPGTKLRKALIVDDALDANKLVTFDGAGEPEALPAVTSANGKEAAVNPPEMPQDGANGGQAEVAPKTAQNAVEAPVTPEKAGED